MTDMKVLRKLREAHIPAYAYSTNFEQQGLTHLRDRIASAEFTRAQENSRPINLYIYAQSDSVQSRRKAMLATALAAKGLCLANYSVVHAHLAGFLREQRMAEMEREAPVINPVLGRIGKGYIAISDFLEFTDVQERYGYHSVQLIADYLLEHVEAGGGLVLGASDIGPLDVTQFGTAFAMLLDQFEAFRV